MDRSSERVTVFVFGSNLAGRHGKGAARTAMRQYGAEYGIGWGPTGNAYAIPTKNRQLRPLSLTEIAGWVGNFLAYARNNPTVTFQVTKIGCGLAGYAEKQIAPLFKNAPSNCELPERW